MPNVVCIPWYHLHFLRDFFSTMHLLITIKGVVLLLVVFHFVFVEGKNQEIAANSLGITTFECAAQHCNDKDSLGLWLEMKNICHIIKRDSYERSLSYGLKLHSFGDGDSSISMVVTGACSAAASLIGILVGYVCGRCCMRYQNSSVEFLYSSIPSFDDGDEYLVEFDVNSSSHNGEKVKSLNW